MLGSGKGTPTIATNPAAISVRLPPGATTDDNLILADSSNTCGYAYSLDTGAASVTTNPFLASGFVPVPPATVAPESSEAFDTGSGNGYTPLVISAAGLAPGTYKTQITINSQDAVTNPTVVPVTLNVTGKQSEPKPKPKPKHKRKRKRHHRHGRR